MIEKYEEKIAALRERYEDLNGIISDPDVISDQNSWQKYVREHSRIEKILDTFAELRHAASEASDAKELLEASVEEDESAWLREEIALCEKRKSRLESNLRRLLIPPDERDDKDAFVEIRAGAGGEEASLFAGDLLRMYGRYAERCSWRVEIVSRSETDLGGMREGILAISGDDVFSYLKYESGVHRVQRVPQTESGGRIHTSTATVAVLPEAEEVELEIDPQDLQVDTFTASGPGGQHVNKTESAVRITHLPTGIVVSCQDEKSQHRNRTQAMKVLRARLLDQMERERDEERSRERRAQVGTGDRSERIRTYNFPQNRITDHRINRTVHQLEQVLDGELDLLVEPLRLEEEQRLLDTVVSAE